MTEVAVNHTRTLFLSPDVRHSKTIGSGSIAWDILSRTQDLTDGLEKLNAVRSRMAARGHDIPHKLEDVIDDKERSDELMTKYSQQREREVASLIPPMRVTFEEVGVGGGIVSNERWYKNTLHQTDYERTIPEVVDYSTSQRKEYETVTLQPIKQTAGIMATSSMTMDPEVALQPIFKNKSDLLSRAPRSPTAAPQPPKRQIPQVTHMRLEGDVGSFLETIQGNKVLQTLDLSHNYKMGDEGLELIIDQLFAHPSLTDVNLSGCCIGDVAAERIGSLMNSDQTIRALDLRWNGITEIGGHFLKKSLNYCSTIHTIQLKSDMLKFQVNRDSNTGALGIEINQSGMITKLHPYVSYHQDDNAVLFPGMVITKIDKKRVSSRNEIQKYLEKNQSESHKVRVVSNVVPKKTLSRIKFKLWENQGLSPS